MKLLIMLAASVAAFAAPVTPLTEARTVQYGDNDIVKVACATGYMTALVLVEEDKIVQYLLGDAENWKLDGFGANGAYVKPTTRATGTNITLVGRSGRHYSFLASVSDSPDIMVYVEPKQTGVAAVKRVKLYTEDDIDAYRKQLVEMNMTLVKVQSAAETVRQESAKKLEVAKAELPKKMKYPYVFERDKAPFNVRNMGHDDRFTYITARPDEVPAVYEEKDGQPKIVNFSFEDGVYVVDKVLANGYLSIGKEKTRFYAR